MENGANLIDLKYLDGIEWPFGLNIQSTFVILVFL